MVFREGIETVLFLAALSIGTNPLMSFLGGTFGVILAVLFAIFFIKGSLKINLAKFFTATSWILMLLVLRLLAGGLHEFGEVGIIPLNPTSMKIIGMIVRDSSTMVISMLLLTIPIVMIFLDNKNPVQSLDNIRENNIEKRKRLAEIQKNKRWRLAVISSVLVINLILGANLVAQAARPTYDPNPLDVSAENGEIKIAVDDLAENVMKKFSYKVDGTDVRFLLIKRFGTVSSGLDACEICGPLGYFQEQGNEEEVICKNCNAPIPISTIGYPGGCNPIAINTEIVDGQVIIKASNLEALKGNFIK